MQRLNHRINSQISRIFFRLAIFIIIIFGIFLKSDRLFGYTLEAKNYETNLFQEESQLEHSLTEVTEQVGTLTTTPQVSLQDFSWEGEWAYGRFEPPNFEPQQNTLFPIYVLARKQSDDSWQLLLPNIHSDYLQWLTVIPTTLLDETTKNHIYTTIFTNFSHTSPSPISPDALAASETTKVLSDGQFVYGPNVEDFNVSDYLQQNAPHLLPYAEEIYQIAEYYSINPRIYLALMESRTQLLSNPNPTEAELDNPFNLTTIGFPGQLALVSEQLFVAYYQQLYGFLPAGIIEDPIVSKPDSTTTHPSNNSNPATTAILSIMAQSDGQNSILTTANPPDFYDSYTTLFPDDDPLSEANHIYSLEELAANSPPSTMFQLPYPRGTAWQFNGVHGALGNGSDMSSIDFAPGWPAWHADTSNMWIAAAADGKPIKVSSCNFKILHADGWETAYFHLDNIQNFGSSIQQNTKIGIIANNEAQALCTTGYSDSPHLHFTLKRNGAWIPLNGVFFSSWKVHSGSTPYDTNRSRMWLERDGVKRYVNDWLSNDSATGALGGRVTYQSGQGVSGAQVSLSTNNNLTTTNADGYYSFPSIAVGSVTVSAWNSNGYGSKTVAVQTNMSNSANIVLAPTQCANSTLTNLNAPQSCGDDQTPPSADNFSVNISGGTATVTASNVSDTGGSNIREVRFSAKWGGIWRGIGTDSSNPYSLTWNMCNSGVPNGAIEFGMEVLDNAGNKFTWSEHHSNLIRTKNYNCPQPNTDVVLCTSSNAQSGCWKFSNGILPNLSVYDLNDKLQSVIVPSGKSVMLFREDGLRGTAECYSGNRIPLPSGDPWDLRGQVTGLQVFSQTGCPSAQLSSVVMYDSQNYSGHHWGIGYKVGVYNLNQIGGSSKFNDYAESIRIPSGWSVKLYEHDNKGGQRSSCLSNNVSTLGNLNNKVSSIEIFGEPNCPVYPPNEPSSLHKSGGGQTTLTMQWQDNSNDENGFNIHRWGWDDSKWRFIDHGSVTANTTTFTDTGLHCNTNYFYTVSAYNNYGVSNQSSWVKATTLTCPAGPLMLHQHTIYDGNSALSQGNGDGLINAGEVIEIKVSLENTGGQTAENVSATLDIMNYDPYVSLQGTTTKGYPNISANSVGTNSQTWRFSVSPTAPNGHFATFCLDKVTASNGGPWLRCFSVMIHNRPAAEMLITTNPVTIGSGNYDLVDFTFTESGGTGVTITGREAWFELADGSELLSDKIGPYTNNIKIKPYGATQWTDYVYLPPAVAKNAQAYNASKIVLRTIYYGIDDYSREVSYVTTLPITIQDNGFQVFLPIIVR